MSDENSSELKEAVPNSWDIERFYELNNALSGVDEIIQPMEYKKNNFVRKILDQLDDDVHAQQRKEKVAIDFSSPNIAKPFHAGHLRSTFIGRALSNMLGSNGSEVVRINYLGDWGTQFGLLAAGYDEFGSDEFHPPLQDSSDKNISETGQRLRQYLSVYVKANERADTDNEFRQKALNYFACLENGDEEKLKFWNRVVEDSLEELKRLYSRLNVQFDAWESERAASSPARTLVQELESRNLTERSEDNVIGIRLDNGGRSQFVPLVKSDGTTLYLTRDIHTALQRFDHGGCTKLIYVTDNTQEHHFRKLKQIFARIGREDVAESIVHVRFGRIRNMSTRKGQVLFVDDLLDDGAQKAESGLLSVDPNTRTPAGTDERRLLADQLALSGLVIYDLRKRFRLEYEFDWQRVLERKQDGGFNFQKTFTRLSSMCQRCERSAVDIGTFRRSVNERESQELIAHVSRRLAPALRRSMVELEMHPLVQYLSRLRKLCGTASKQLRVVDAPTPALRDSRLLLFDVARKVLGIGLRLLGAKPLPKI